MIFKKDRLQAIAGIHEEEELDEWSLRIRKIGTFEHEDTTN
jgi:hypothetical protein